MSWVYILKSKNDRYYIGSTTDLERRLKQHASGLTRTTRVLQASELVYTEKFDTISEARFRERKLKSYKSKRYIKWLIENRGPIAQR